MQFRSCRATGTLIVPDQPGAPWWPSLRHGHGWAAFVKDVRVLGPARTTLLGLSARYSDTFGSRNVLALRVDGR